ncbi:MAG: hypothetical protein JXA95_18490 [Spirochaetales bacterium]|nr:hypothetical protein [Spirochaetales bacterium]
MGIVAIIADIIKSREIQNRGKFQKELELKLSEMSKRENILSPYTITLGDEFQAIYRNTDQVLTDIMEIMRFLYPVKIRVSLGIGDLDTEINRKRSLGMDGPAFHMAREGIEALKKIDTNMVRIYDTQGGADLELINRGFALALSEIDGWKYNTLKTFTDLLMNRTINEIYPQIGISQRGVYKLIQTNNLEKYVDYFGALNKKLRERYS